MPNKILDFPQDNLPGEEKIKKETPERKPRPPRGKSILGKLLSIITIVALILTGFVFVQKTLLDLEAQAKILAAQTQNTTSVDIQGLNTVKSAKGLPLSFAKGSLIIPMDTDTTGNHASYNQNLGMWKAYGLIDRLLQNGIPVYWVIKVNKSYNDIDFTASSVSDLRTLTGLGSWDYRSGPFIIDSTNAGAALPIITAWWAQKGNQPNVHKALASVNAEVDVTLRSTLEGGKSRWFPSISVRAG